ncbi:MAG: hypothetical protein DHS20C15_30020 [Planctomycetota bacterium]|nr:MAG: hypothetical protein DHS20C15_30020 [Planctomycetota bacterium]
MTIEVQGLSLGVGYRGDWHAAVPDPTPLRMRLLKEASRLAMRQQYAWLNGPPCDVLSYHQVVANLQAAFNSGSGQISDDAVRESCCTLIRCKQPSLVEGAYDVQIDPADLYGDCVPAPAPPPFSWWDRHVFNLIKPNGKRASVTVTADGVEVKVKLIVAMNWEVPEIPAV